MMAEEDVEQLVASLQAARNASSEWETLQGPSSISMLLFGHQVKHPPRLQIAPLSLSQASCHMCNSESHASLLEPAFATFAGVSAAAALLSSLGNRWKLHCIENLCFGKLHCIYNACPDVLSR